MRDPLWLVVLSILATPIVLAVALLACFVQWLGTLADWYFLERNQL